MSHPVFGTYKIQILKLKQTKTPFIVYLKFGFNGQPEGKRPVCEGYEVRGASAGRDTEEPGTPGASH